MVEEIFENLGGVLMTKILSYFALVVFAIYIFKLIKKKGRKNNEE